MKKEIIQKIEIPQGVSCHYDSHTLKCEKGSVTLHRKILIPSTDVKVHQNEIVFHCKQGNKNTYKSIMSALAHISNMFFGLDEKFVYRLESANVHFPMTLKIEGNQVKINNFLGEKVPRQAKILPGVEVKIDGAKITVTSNDREAAGQTAANLEKATKLTGRDRRIFQDGIYIVEKPGRKS